MTTYLKVILKATMPIFSIISNEQKLTWVSNISTFIIVGIILYQRGHSAIILNQNIFIATLIYESFLLWYSLLNIYGYFIKEPVFFPLLIIVTLCAFVTVFIIWLKHQASIKKILKIDPSKIKYPQQAIMYCFNFYKTMQDKSHT